MIGSPTNELYKIWLLFDPRKALIGMFAFLIFLALLIHMLLLSTDRYNWVEGAATGGGAVAVEQAAVPVEGQTQ
jgi:light-harvesting complex 1 alpha chain